ncbi:Ldh family oxidoreductase [Candidatus Bipolaricaulota bacterium]
MRVLMKELRETVMATLAHYGYEPEECMLMCDVILYAQIRDNNQGIVKLVGKGMPKARDSSAIQIVKDSQIFALFDGNNSPGMVVLARAVDLAIEKANHAGVGIVGARGTGSSSGALGYYARRMASRGVLGFVFAGSPPAVCPYGSTEAVFGTNPIAVGIPSVDEPIVVDMATSAMSWYGLIEAAGAGRSIPEGVAYDSNGVVTTNPEEAMQGSILPFDRDKRGSALSLLVEVLTGPLVGASFAGIGDVSGNWGHLALALDPSVFVERAAFESEIDELRNRIKRGRKSPGTHEILLPGERGSKLAATREIAGEIDVEESLWRALKQVATGNDLTS